MTGQDKPGPRPLAVIDIDGVLADVRHRLRHLQRWPEDWQAFFAAAGDDPPLAEGLAVARRLAEDHEVVYLSGRPEWLRPTTTAWLREHGFPAGRVLLRARHDRRPARRVKVEALRRLAAAREVAVHVDDDAAVVAAVRAAGFPVLEADWAREPETEPTLFDAQERQGRT